MKIVPFALLILIACGGSEVEDKEGYHCYLYSAFYLIEGDTEVARSRTEEVKHLWKGWGQIEDAFYAYAPDNLKMFSDRKERAEYWLSQGLPCVARTYSGGGHYTALRLNHNNRIQDVDLTLPSDWMTFDVRSDNVDEIYCSNREGD